MLQLKDKFGFSTLRDFDAGHFLQPRSGIQFQARFSPKIIFIIGNNIFLVTAEFFSDDLRGLVVQCKVVLYILTNVAGVENFFLLVLIALVLGVRILDGLLLGSEGVVGIDISLALLGVLLGGFGQLSVLGVIVKI